MQTGKKKQIFGTGLNEATFSPELNLCTVPAKRYECPSIFKYDFKCIKNLQLIDVNLMPLFKIQPTLPLHAIFYNFFEQVCADILPTQTFVRGPIFFLLHFLNAPK